MGELESKDVLDYLIYMAEDRVGTNRSLLGALAQHVVLSDRLLWTVQQQLGRAIAKHIKCSLEVT